MAARSALRRGLLITALLAGLVALYGTATFIDVWLTSRREYRGEVLGDDRRLAALVLGAAQYNGEPSPVLRQRLDLAVELFDTDRVSLIVVTGGGREGDATTEAKASYDYLRERGVPDDRVLLEVQGTSTYESIAAAHRFLVRDEVNQVVLVTDRFHARRALLVAEEVGFAAEVALTEPGPPLDRLVKESAAVGLGRIIGFRRLERLTD